MTYSTIFIICNPKSTGDSLKNAKKMKTDLSKVFTNIEVKLQKTKYAGHAQKLAYQLSLSSKRPLIISSSGDGGYNEVVNGVIKAQLQGAKPICAVLASGNANDHSRTLYYDSLLKSIIAKKVGRIDLLKINIKNGSKEVERYAHSYIGFGLTPIVAVELNKTDLNAFKELWIIARTFHRFRPIKIKYKNIVMKLDSIIFANIGEMAKILTISKKSKPDDGLFEIVTFKHGHKIRLLHKLAKATMTNLDSPKQSKYYEFITYKSMPAQLDGEVIKIKPESSIKITSEHKLLTTILN